MKNIVVLKAIAVAVSCTCRTLVLISVKNASVTARTNQRDVNGRVQKIEPRVNLSAGAAKARATKVASETTHINRQLLTWNVFVLRWVMTMT